MPLTRPTRPWEDNLAVVLGLICEIAALLAASVGILLYTWPLTLLMFQSVLFLIIALASAFNERNRILRQQVLLRLRGFVQQNPPRDLPSVPTYGDLATRNVLIGLLFMPVLWGLGLPALVALQTLRATPANDLAVVALLSLTVAGCVFIGLAALEWIGHSADHWLGMQGIRLAHGMLIDRVTAPITPAYFGTFGTLLFGTSLVIVTSGRDIVPQPVLLALGLITALLTIWNALRPHSDRPARAAILKAHGPGSPELRAFDARRRAASQSGFTRGRWLAQIWIGMCLVVTLTVLIMTPTVGSLVRVGVVVAGASVLWLGVHALNRLFRRSPAPEASQIDAAMRSGRLDEAEGLADAWLERLPITETQLETTLTIIQVGKPDKAEVILRAALTDMYWQINPDRDNALMLLGIALTMLAAIQLARQELDAAEQTLEWALFCKPNDGWAITNQAELLLNQRRPNDALLWIERMQVSDRRLKQSPLTTPLYEAWALAQLGHTERIEALVQEGMARAQASGHPLVLADGHYYRGRIAQTRGDTVAAREAFDCALAVDPQGIIAYQTRLALVALPANPAELG